MITGNVQPKVPTDVVQRIRAHIAEVEALGDSDPRRAVELARRAVELAEQEQAQNPPAQDLLVDSLLALAGAHHRAGECDSALSLFLRALALAERETDWPKIARALDDVALIYARLGAYSDAMFYLLELLQGARDAQDRACEARALYHIGTLYLHLHDYETSLTYLHQCLPLLRQLDDRQSEAGALRDCSSVYFRLGDFERALTVGRTGLQLCREIGHRAGEAEALNSLGEVYTRQGRYEQAMTYYHSALEIAQEIDLPYEGTWALYHLGQVLCARGQPEQAATFFHQALDRFQELDARDRLADCHLALAGLYRQLGDFERALVHFEQYHALEHRILEQKSSDVLRALQVAHEVETARKEAEIYQLRNIALCQEIEERRQAEETLRQYAAELEVRNEELDAFAHTVAHDLRSPLHLIIGVTEMVRSDRARLKKQELDNYLTVAVRTGHKMQHIIGELLLFAQLRQGKAEIHPLDMADVVRGALGQVEWLLSESNVEVSVPDTWPRALGYAPWIEQVWVNYLNNAVKYSQEDGRVEVGAEVLDTGAACFWVRDYGPGIAPEEQERLFRPFTHLDQLRLQGFGLGLSIVRRIVEELGGQVGVKSELGQGSTFYFTLPVAQA